MDNREGLWKLQKGTMTMFLGEVVGTGVLLFVGCMGGVGTLGRAPPPPMQSAFTFGLTVNMIIMMLGHISGAHLNPAVTIGSIIIRQKTIATGLVYMIAQFVGAIIGYGLLKIVTPEALFTDGFPDSSVPLCVTVVHPGITTIQAVLIEILCTAIVLCTACATWDPRCAHTTDSVALKFGMAIAGLSFAASPYTGCSMNPARTFAPAFFNGAWENQWIYWIGPVLGAFLGTYTYQVLFSASKEEADTAYSRGVELSVIHDKLEGADSP
ncbi:aquaporin isoform X1 [Diachasma alloeum]|uniref:aquaporin isoform X1 n=1 Tax=Diachasma alloeum TaxID=454923 RepID=UPI00073845A4|nr:aquaporin isoform X1 [Diachasma alloeum]